jgi:hypothetical protein
VFLLQSGQTEDHADLLREDRNSGLHGVDEAFLWQRQAVLCQSGGGASWRGRRRG